MLTNKGIHTPTETLTMGPDITCIGAYGPSNEQPLWHRRHGPALGAVGEDGSAGASDELDEVEDDELDEDDEDADDDEEEDDDDDEEEDDEDEDEDDDVKPGN